MEQKYPDLFHVDIEYEPDLNNDEWLKQYDIIHYHRTLGDYAYLPALLDRLDKLNVVTVMDLDDYWAPGPHHPAYLLIKNSGLDKMIINNLRISRNVTTTTNIFANEISRLNKRVFVLPNAIDPKEKQFTPKPEPSDRLRIGWLGGSSHLKDLELLKDVVGTINRNGLIDKVQFVLCGYDLRGTITTISPEYKEFLLRFKPEEYKNVANEPYRRVWTKPISTYASNYNLFDISLAPIEDNTFNKVKSQLKVIEAGFHKKAIIAEDLGPYQIDIKKANLFGGEWDATGNGILIEPKKNQGKDWAKYIKKLIENPDLVTQLSENLYNTVKDTYSMDKVTDDRKDLYLKLLAEKNK